MKRLILLAVLTGCGSEEDQMNASRIAYDIGRVNPITQLSKDTSIDPVFRPYLVGYPDKIKDVGIQFGIVSQMDRLGECQIDVLGHKKILVNQKFWGQQSTCMKEMILWHELGHCLHYKHHSNDPDSLMNAFADPDRCEEIMDRYK